MNKKLITLISTVCASAGAIIATSTGISKINPSLAEECPHSNVNHYDALPATCASNGHIEYWVCCDCHTSFSDAGLTTVIDNTTGDPTDSSDGRHTDHLTVYEVSEPLEQSTVDATGISAPDGFEEVYGYTGKGTINAKYRYLDLSQFKEITWAVKAASADNKWYEAFKEYNSSEELSCGGTTDWTVYKFVDEGNGYFQGYKNGSWIGCQLDSTYNLGQMYVKFTDGATFYHTEVRCKLKDTDTPFSSGVTKINDYIADSFWDDPYNYADETFDWAYNNQVPVINKATGYSCYSLFSADASEYTDFMFGIRATCSAAWTYIDVNGTKTSESDVPTSWTTAWAHKESDGTWTFRWWKFYASGITLTNSNEIKIQVAKASYQVTSLYGIAA